MSVALVAFVVPVVVLAIGLCLTRRLRARDPVEWPPPVRMTLVYVSSILLTAAVYVVVGIWWFESRDPRAIQSLILAGLLALAWLVARTSKDRRAARAVVADLTATVGLLVLFFLYMFLYSSGGPSLAVGFSSMAVLFLLFGVVVVTAWVGRPACPRSAFRFVALGLFAVLVVVAVPDVVRRKTATLEDAVRWIDTFDQPADEMLDWAAMGRTAHWIRTQELAEISGQVPADLIRWLIRSDARLHSSTLVGAFDAGLLQREDLEPIRDRWWYPWARNRATEHDLRVVSPPEAKLRVYVTLEPIVAAERRRLVDRLARAWPTDQGFGRLEQAHEICLLLELLGASERIAEHREALHAMLLRSYCDEAPAYGYAGGFSLNDDERLRDSDPRATWFALEIMRHVGVPEGIDLDRTAEYLYVKSRPYRHFTDARPLLSSLKRDAQLAWLRLRTEHDVVLPDRFGIAALGAPLSALLFAVFAVVVLLRSPRAQVRLRADLVPHRANPPPTLVPGSEVSG